MIPVDPWHTAMAEWRAAIVTELETQYAGCSDHTHGPYPREEVNA